jgi:hypothetical protein
MRKLHENGRARGGHTRLKTAASVVLADNVVNRCAWSHDRAHAFFSRANWIPDLPGIPLSHLVVRQLLPGGAVLTVAVDETPFKRRGRTVLGAAWQYDGAATGPRGGGRGTCFVMLGLVVDLPPFRPGRRACR